MREKEVENLTMTDALSHEIATALELTVEDINDINRFLEKIAPVGGEPGSIHHRQRMRIADLQWKLIALGQSIERKELP